MPDVWRFTWPFLPSSINHRYGNRKDGGKYLLAKAKGSMSRMQGEVWAAGFRVDLAKCYEIEIVFTMPDWGHDIDGPIKETLDACFGHLSDHRVTKLVVTKRVESGQSQTDVTIREMQEG